MNFHYFLQIIVTYRVNRAAIILICSLPFLILLIFLLVRSVRKQKKRLSLLRTTREMEILKARIETQEQTLLNISADLHDNIGQKLSLVYFLSTRLADSGIETGDIPSLLRKAIADLRDLSHSLSGDTIRVEGLQAAIRHEINLLNKGNLLRAEFFPEGDEVEIQTDKATLLYRVFQEAIQNVLKHAKAAVVKIFLSREDNELHMKIADNGIGFDPAAAEGHGLRNMRSRLKLIHGTLDIEKTTVGTTLFIKIPLDK